MIPEEKLKQFKKQLTQGIPSGEIRESMKRDGYSDEEIETVFTSKDRDMRMWFLVSSIIVFCIGIYQMTHQQGILVLVLGGALFVQYLREVKRWEKKESLPNN